MDSIINVILVDDHPLVMEGLRSFLDRDHGIIVLAVFDKAKDLLAQLPSYKVDVIVMDIRMPEMNGFELARSIKAGYESIRLVMLSGYSYEEYQRAAFEIGVHAFVPKNAPYSSIVNAIRQSFLGNILVTERAMQYMNRDRLTRMEHRILQLIAQEQNNQQISDELGISKRTTESHISSILIKLGVDSRVGAVVKGFQNGILNA
ncbi:response regulator transcription factor [Paenibacillus rhizophilus]|uniref:DNA-binding response regulator n=1 Tax=Paenibacillus rhizophilus TaxID=1850366 RepID=A0A3N9P3L8_9BACL|nr:response regulator transcription factor [Paenibacillus rhizophilus]RQW09674.1 DNA-binding response regulator [Paenibacillus rhizophilus]